MSGEDYKVKVTLYASYLSEYEPLAEALERCGFSVSREEHPGMAGPGQKSMLDPSLKLDESGVLHQGKDNLLKFVIKAEEQSRSKK